MNSCRSVIACALLAVLAPASFADIVLKTDVPAAASTAANPFAFDIYNNAGEPFRVNVTDITRGMTPAQKAARIRAAVMGQAPAFLRGAGGILNHVTLNNSANKVKLVNDPTKEGFDKLNSDQLASASYGGSGSSTGFDPDGNSSVVRCGIEGIYVAQLLGPGSMSASAILSSLRSDLVSNGISAEISAGELVIMQSLSPGQEFVFGSTDTGFSGRGNIAIVPTPAGAIALASLGLMQFRRRR